MIEIGAKFEVWTGMGTLYAQGELVSVNDDETLVSVQFMDRDGGDLQTMKLDALLLDDLVMEFEWIDDSEE